MPLIPDLDSSSPRRATFPNRSTAADIRARGVVAIVTADTELAEACARVLEHEGYAVQTAVHSGHALLASLRGRIDVLISQMSLEEVSGPALTERMRRQNPAMQAIYLAKAGTHAAADNLLIRPFTREDLLSAVARYFPGI